MTAPVRYRSGGTDHHCEVSFAKILGGKHSYSGSAQSSCCQQFDAVFRISGLCPISRVLKCMTKISPRLLKTKQAAEYLSVSAWKLRNLVQAGEIPCILGDGTSPWLFDRQDLDNWIEERKRTL